MHCYFLYMQFFSHMIWSVNQIVKTIILFNLDEPLFKEYSATIHLDFKE